MALPILETTRHDLNIPSSGETISYRPFLVKEQKMIMIATETGNQGDMINSMIDIVNSCTFNKIKAENLASFDLEYIFLKIRSKSMGSEVKLNIICEDDGETQVETKVNIDEIEIKFPENLDPVLQLTNDIFIELGYPTMKEISNIFGKNDEASDIQVTQLFDMIKTCVVRIVEKSENKVYEKQDFSDEDLDSFLDSLNNEQFAKIEKFFNEMPKLRHEIKVTNPNTKKRNKVILEGLQSFLE
jgi:hypothetical protein